jgi:hypothetical protein
MSTSLKLSRKRGAITPSPKTTPSKKGAIAPPTTTLPPGALINNVSQSTAPIQAKLTVGAVGDKYEQEADRVAAEVVHTLNVPTTQRQALANPFSHVAQRTTIQRQSTPPTIQRDTPPTMADLLAGRSGSAAAASGFSVANPGLSAQTVKDAVTVGVNAKPFIAALDSSPWTWADIGFELERIYCAEAWHLINAVGEYQKAPTRSNFLGIMKDFIETSGTRTLNIGSATRKSYLDKAAEMATSGELDSPAANHFNDALVLQETEITHKSMDAYQQQIAYL